MRARRVHQRVQAPEGVGRLGDRLRRGPLVAQVEAQREDLAPVPVFTSVARASAPAWLERYVNATSLPRSASMRTTAAPMPPVPPATGNATPVLLEKLRHAAHSPRDLAMMTFMTSLVPA